MTASNSRIYKVRVDVSDLLDVTSYVRATSRAQAERHAMKKYVTSCVASQDDIIEACRDKKGGGIEDARKEETVDGQDKD